MRTTLRTRVLLTATTVCMIGLGVAAQSRPDFSGVWEMDMERTRAENRARSAAAGGGGGSTMSGGSMAGGGAGAPAVTAVRITQTATDLTISRVSGQAWEKVVHKLDGSESVNTSGRSIMKLKSRWDGARLVSEGTSETQLPDSGEAIRGVVKEVRWIDRDGTMVMESTRTITVPPSMQVSNAGKPTVTIQYFVKK